MSVNYLFQIYSHGVLAFITLCCISIKSSFSEDGNLTSPPFLTASSMIPLSKDKLDLISFAAKLSDAAYLYDNAIAVASTAPYVADIANHPGSTYVNTGADAVLTLSIDSYCFVAFRGTFNDENFLTDWFDQNLNFASILLPNNSTPNCAVQVGYYNAYNGTGGIDYIRNFTRTCMTASDVGPSTNDKKQLVFTGHSQGGATAAIASIMDIEYDPLTITFGQPPFQSPMSNCGNILKKEHFWRIINTENSINRLHYDVVPFAQLIFLNITMGDHFGESLHLPPSVEGTIVTTTTPSFSLSSFYRSAMDVGLYMNVTELDVLPDSNSTNSSFMSAHSTIQYVSKLSVLRLNGSDPLNVAGYANGTQCNKDFECFSCSKGPGMCYNSTCVISSSCTEQEQKSSGSFYGKEKQNTYNSFCISWWIGVTTMYLLLN